VAGSTFWFLEAAPVSVRFRATEADFRERADDSHEPEVDSLARVGEPGVELPVPVADFRA
jgi:hypothetical protein